MMSLGEKSAYEPFVKLCNEVLNAARTRDFADDINKHLKPEDPKCKIEFIRYEKLFTEYDWTDTHNSRTAGKRCSLTVKPDILVVRRDGIEDYKANQAAVKGTDFDPSEDPTSAKGADCRVRLKDVLSYIELKWKEKAAILQINQGLKPPRVSTGEYLNPFQFSELILSASIKISLKIGLKIQLKVNVASFVS